MGAYAGDSRRLWTLEAIVSSVLVFSADIRKHSQLYIIPSSNRAD